jgi:hypothetical protein
MNEHKKIGKYDEWRNRTELLKIKTTNMANWYNA